MGAKLGGGGGLMADINVTPLIDVVLATDFGELAI